METVTFPQEEVVRFMSDNVIPLRLPHDHKPLAENFNVKWTPTLILLDKNGKEHHRTVGFLPPEELMASVLLGIGKMFFDVGKYQEAIQVLDKVVDQYEKSGAAPEAIFVRAVAQFKTTNETSHLKKAYEILKEKYPESEWAKRALPYRLL